MERLDGPTTRRRHQTSYVSGSLKPGEAPDGAVTSTPSPARTTDPRMSPSRAIGPRTAARAYDMSGSPRGVATPGTPGARADRRYLFHGGLLKHVPGAEEDRAHDPASDTAVAGRPHCLPALTGGALPSAPPPTDGSARRAAVRASLSWSERRGAWPGADPRTASSDRPVRGSGSYHALSQPAPSSLQSMTGPERSLAVRFGAPHQEASRPAAAYVCLTRARQHQSSDCGVRAEAPVQSGRVRHGGPAVHRPVGRGMATASIASGWGKRCR